MIVEFIKNHPVGIPNGTIKELDEKFAQKMIDQGFAKESNQTELDNFRKSLQDATKTKLANIQAKQAEQIKAKKDQEAASIKTKEEDCGCGDKVKKEDSGACEDCERKKELSSLKKDEIIVLVEKLGLPEEEYNSLNKDPLIEYLISKEKK